MENTINDETPEIQQPEENQDPEKGRAKPVRKPKTKTERTTPYSEQERLTIALPEYLMDQLRIKAATKKSTVRYEILRGLKNIGYDIKDDDYLRDARRKKRGKK